MEQNPQFPTTHCNCPSNHNPNINLPDSPHYHRPPPVINNQKTNQQQQQQQVSAACSMPNLNHGSPNIDYNNAAAVRLLENSLNNSVHNSMMHGGGNHHQLWNGQALNNQVAPGNRANNYWDNFRR